MKGRVFFNKSVSLQNIIKFPLINISTKKWFIGSVITIHPKFLMNWVNFNGTPIRLGAGEGNDINL